MIIMTQEYMVSVEKNIIGTITMMIIDIINTNTNDKRIFIDVMIL